VGPATVVATFFNFHPTMVRRSIPDAWTFADPDSVLAARRKGAAAALRRIDPSAVDRAGHLVPRLARAVAGADGSGWVLFSANRALDAVDEPWRSCGRPVPPYGSTGGTVTWLR
jgi:hypothetical protein